MEDKQVFIVNGKPRAGKDTFALILGKHIRLHKYSSIDKIKQIAIQCGWRMGKTEKDRKFLSDLKNLCTEYSDLPFEDLYFEVTKFKNYDVCMYGEIMLIDIREPEEIARACKEFDAKSIFIENVNVPSVTSNMADANVENYEYDYIIKNNGSIAEFEEEIIKFINIIKGEC